MADGSSEDRTGPKQINDLTFSALDTEHGDTKKCDEEAFQRDRVNLSFYIELEKSESCEYSVSRGVACDRSTVNSTDSQKVYGANAESQTEDRKKRCFDRYDSSESSDSGVAVLSPPESSACSGSEVASPVSPRSPESACSAGWDGPSGARMPPWAGEPAPPAPPRRRTAQPATTRQPQNPHRRITDFFNQKMKPKPSLKRDTAPLAVDDNKKRCLPRNGVTQDLEKYISFLSQTLSPKVLQDVDKKADVVMRNLIHNHVVADKLSKAGDLTKNVPNSNVNGVNGTIDYSNKPKDGKDKSHTTVNGFAGLWNGTETLCREKPANGALNGLCDGKTYTELKSPSNPFANGIVNGKQQKRKASTPKLTDVPAVRIAPATSINNRSPRKIAKTDATKNGVVSSTTKIDSRINGVTCGSNNISLNPNACKPTVAKKESPKKAISPPKRTNRKSSACIANSKNLTWSKANNLKQIQLQNQNCANLTPSSPSKNVPGEASTAPNMNIPNGLRQVSMTVNGSLGNLNVPVTNIQNCHQVNIPQSCNGTMSSNNLTSFVAVPQNMMLTALRIPQNGLPAQSLNQQSNMNAYNRPNINVSSPTKLNGQFVFPFVQNLNGTVVQIPNLMAKMPNFVLPQNHHLATQQRQDHIQTQQAAQILINGTLLKLANTMTSTYSSVNKPVTTTTQSIPMMNKNLASMPSMGMTMQPKPNYTVNLSHPMLMPQPGFIVTSVPNINVKEACYTTTNAATALHTTCSNPIVHHPPPMVANFTTQTLHSSSIPIAPVKPPDNPIQGTDPPSSTVKELESTEMSTTKCDIPWLSKTVNNNIVPLDSKMPMRPFSNIGIIADKLKELKDKIDDNEMQAKSDIRTDNSSEELRKVEEVARREDTIFTQITVLKDVSSNVQHTMIEANFSCATTESSESGIGTDKSIDSPSDSQTSKECDEDSSLSLSVSICSVEGSQSSQKSPILKQPKTLRFPPRSSVKPNGDKRTSSTDTSSTVTVCLWENCKKDFESDTDLLEHLQSVHVESQAGKESYVCLWQQCKVRGKPSCSRLWLARHALSHGGNKPFKCIVDGCERRFSTQILLERHVNNHFTEASPNAGAGKKTSDSAAKLIRRNGKKLRYRRQPWSARMFDYFDAGIMEGLAWRLSRATRWRVGGACPLREPTGTHTLTLTAALAATRYNATLGRREALVTYYPPHVLEDEWVPEKEVQRVKLVEIASLPAHTKVALYEQYSLSYRRRGASPPPPPRPAPPRRAPPRHCSSSRLLNKLLAKKRARSECSATNVPPPPPPEEDAPETPSGAKKRKMGRRYGGNSFWPCGR